MGRSDLGLVKPGYLADLILVEGDPSVDVSVLQHAEKLTAIMKNGKFHKLPPEAHSVSH
jgi:imidazolonepropionase-like amidohydrolase